MKEERHDIRVRLFQPLEPAGISPAVRPALLATWAFLTIGFSFSVALRLILTDDILQVSPATLSLFFRQDLIGLAASVVVLPAAYVFVSWKRVPTLQERLVLHRLFLPGVYSIFALTCSLGVAFIYHRYALSMDEFTARFQAEALRGGYFFAPVPERWAEWVEYLQPLFVRYEPINSLWAPAYLPGNALLLAGFDLIRLMPWTHVISGTLCLWLTARICKKVWPATPWAPALGAFLLASSAQFWITAMTSYAMTLHLLASLAWLLFFLRDDKRGHAMALAFAPLAMGIHQLYIHPLVALPFISWLAIDRRWKLLGLYGLWYAGWIGFWVMWGGILTPENPGVGVSGGTGLQVFWTTFQSLVARRNATDLLIWWINLLRFASWQNVAMLPLVVVGLASVRHAPRPVRAGVVAVLVILLGHVVMMPSQGHGWGYRYLHPVLGFLVLASVHGAVRLAGISDSQRKMQTQRLLVVITLASLLLLPLRAVQVERLVRPFAAAAGLIQRSQAEFVLVDELSIWYGLDLVRNDPLLERSPRVLAASLLSERELARLCEEFWVEVVDIETVAPLGLPANPEEASPRVRERAKRAGCALLARNSNMNER